ncbi:MAG: phage holin family protein [Methanomicrobiales archaeon]|nr:phage holin family protein [Methanomicrobiales archaeon]
MVEEEGKTEELSVESELASTLKYLDLYLRQKTDLFIQHYLLEPFGFISKQLAVLSVLLALLASGTVIIVAGVILLLSTFVPLWASLLIVGAGVFICAAIIAQRLFSRNFVLDTPTVDEVKEHEWA